jgi:hypothetical protein
VAQEDPRLQEKLLDYIEDAHATEQKTADAARTNRADEEAMAQKLASYWDKFLTIATEVGTRA